MQNGLNLGWRGGTEGKSSRAVELFGPIVIVTMEVGRILDNVLGIQDPMELCQVRIRNLFGEHYSIVKLRLPD